VRSKLGKGKVVHRLPDGSEVVECTPIRNLKPKANARTLKPAANVKSLKPTPSVNTRFILRINRGSKQPLPLVDRAVLKKKLEEHQQKKAAYKPKPPSIPSRYKPEAKLKAFDQETKGRLPTLKIK
jgi:hypothetical protein